MTQLGHRQTEPNASTKSSKKPVPSWMKSSVARCISKPNNSSMTMAAQSFLCLPIISMVSVRVSHIPKTWQPTGRWTVPNLTNAGGSRSHNALKCETAAQLSRRFSFRFVLPEILKIKKTCARRARIFSKDNPLQSRHQSPAQTQACPPPRLSVSPSGKTSPRRTTGML